MLNKQKYPPFCRWLFIEFFLVFIISTFLLIWIYGKVWLFLSLNQQFFLSKILFSDISLSWYFPLLLMAVIVFFSWRFIPVLVGFSSRIIHTPFIFYHYVHGIFLGLLVSLVVAFFRYLSDFQNVFFFCGDFLVLSVIASIIIWLIERKLKKRVVEKNGSSSVGSGNPLWLLDERPIASEEADLFQHKRIASEIERVIFGNTGINGRVIALYGRNGSGKTSILNLLENVLHNKGVSVGRLEPYSFRSEKEISKAFFGLLSGLLCQNAILPKVSTIPDKYLSLFYGFTGLTSPIRLFVQSVHDYLSKTYNAEYLRSIFNWYLSERNERLLVIIDDIDRCSVRSRHLLFQLINTIGRINNLYFIISASPNELLGQKEPTLISLVD